MGQFLFLRDICHDHKIALLSRRINFFFFKGTSGSSIQFKYLINFKNINKKDFFTTLQNAFGRIQKIKTPKIFIFFIKGTFAKKRYLDTSPLILNL